LVSRSDPARKLTRRERRNRRAGSDMTFAISRSNEPWSSRSASISELSTCTTSYLA
jgi:hypothetical protein